MKKCFASALLASLTGSLAAGGAAHAATSTTPITFSNDISTNIGNTLTGAGSFTDIYTFSYTSQFDVTSAIISISQGTGSGLTFSSFTLTNTTTGQIHTGTSSINAILQTYTIKASKLSIGDYVLSASGSAAGLGGSYGGNINVAAVPEASTTAMMLAGLAVVGLMAARRRHKATAVPDLDLGRFAAA
ncbi:MAG: hypothetical protein GAK35_03746 [Herbaspirillum frisingense]|uniref:Ice-binding protein C-terminal domain-containing protein n=1 Tax=Herbaspirillum frisingense TaxID=92645 RepID=A0A7V8FTN2_9BURK|nr:MAG: hypothetical protein GAK35_03746 [Herbaspirillum frisingense]